MKSENNLSAIQSSVLTPGFCPFAVSISPTKRHAVHHKSTTHVKAINAFVLIFAYEVIDEFLGETPSSLMAFKECNLHPSCHSDRHKSLGKFDILVNSGREVVIGIVCQCCYC